MDASGDVELKGAVTARELVLLKAGGDIITQNGALLSVPGDAQPHSSQSVEELILGICLGGDMQLSAKGTIHVSRNTWLGTSECHGAGSVLLSAKEIHMSGTISAMDSPELCTLDASITSEVVRETHILAKCLCHRPHHRVYSCLRPPLSWMG